MQRALFLAYLLLAFLFESAHAQVHAESKQVAETIRQLRKPVHQWLVKTPESVPYADLILAYGLARAGDAEQAKQLGQQARATLPKADDIHQILGKFYGYRIDQALAGKPDQGLLPHDLLKTAHFLDQDSKATRMAAYKLRQARVMSRILEPRQRIDPYLVYLARGTDPVIGRFASLAMREDADFARDAQAMLKESVGGAADTRRDVLLSLAGIAPTGGDALCADVLKGLQEIASAARKTNDTLPPWGLGLIDSSLALSVACRKPEPFKLMVVEAIDYIRKHPDPRSVAILTVQCERGFRVMSLTQDAQLFLREVGEALPQPADAPAFEKEWKENWSNVARIVLAEQGIREVAEKRPPSPDRLDLVRDAFSAPHPVRMFSEGELLSEYAFACGRLPPAEARRRIEELLSKDHGISNTYSTSSHYSRYHLMILESTVLGMAAATDF